MIGLLFEVVGSERKAQAVGRKVIAQTIDNYFISDFENEIASRDGAVV